MKFVKILYDSTVDAVATIILFISNNLMNFAKILNFILPYLMLFIGMNVMESRGEYAAGGEIFIPLIFVILNYYLKSSANKIGKGTTVPVPEKRFTEVTDDGEVSIEQNRLQELILYVADLEDWLERKGIL